MGKIISVLFLLVSGIAVFFIRNDFVYNIADYVNNIMDAFFFELATWKLWNIADRILQYIWLLTEIFICWVSSASPDLLSSIFHHALCTERLTCINRLPCFPLGFSPAGNWEGKTREELGYLFPRLLPSKTASAGCIPPNCSLYTAYFLQVLVSTSSPPLLCRPRVHHSLLVFPAAHIVYPTPYSLKIVPGINFPQNT